jgi:hypothetical protein
MQKEGGRYALNRIYCPKSPIADGWECAKKHLGLPPSVFCENCCILYFTEYQNSLSEKERISYQVKDAYQEAYKDMFA